MKKDKNFTRYMKNGAFVEEFTKVEELLITEK
jgi:hypothetical protein